MSHKIAVVGLGYVGLPLAVALAKYFDVTGFDIDAARIDELNRGIDRTDEVSKKGLQDSTITLTDDLEALRGSDIFIITVPTPVTDQNKPDLTPLERASKSISKVLQKGNIVVYESTVYPGVTEDFCAPILEKETGLKAGEDFYLGYSPERMNPGDKDHNIYTLTKVVSGQTPAVTKLLADMYGKVNNGNVFCAADIRTAEAAKVIENAQRDINIAFINEVTMIFNKMDISIHDVLAAAQTKWNFLPFTPGLVGGHCIGVDPYYLAESAKGLGHNPEVILSGRRINDSMGHFIAERVHEKLKSILSYGKSGRILVLGLTFKENVPDLRNTRVIDIIKTLESFGHKTDVHDAYAASAEAKEHYGIELISETLMSRKSAQAVGQTHSSQSSDAYDCVLLAVPHDQYCNLPSETINGLLREGGLLVDIKGTWKEKELCDSFHLWTL